MTSEQDRIAFLKERKTGIGGSDMAAIKGLSPFKTAVSVWLDKTNPAIDPTSPSARLELGNWLEAPLAHWYEEQTGRKTQRYTKMLRKGHVIGHIDRLVCPEGKTRAITGQGKFIGNRFLEIKTTSKPHDWENGVPPYYYDQIFTYFGLVDAFEVCDVPYAVIAPGVERNIASVERDDELAKAQIEFGNAWWEEYVIGNKPPPCTCEADCKAIWRVREKGRIYTATPEVVEAVARLKEINARQATLEEEADGLRTRIENAMGECDTVKTPEGETLLTWRQSDGRKTTAWKEVCKEAGVAQSIIDAHTKQGEPYRTFKLSA